MYCKFYLRPGETPPVGTTSQAMSDGGIAWIGEKWVAKDIEYHEMSINELSEYEMYLKYSESRAFESGIDFADVWPIDSTKLDAKIAQKKQALDNVRTAITAET